VAAKKTTQAKIKEAKASAKYAQKEVTKLNENRVGSISYPKKGGIIVSNAKQRAAASNSLTSASKTAGRAKNVETKLKAKRPTGELPKRMSGYAMAIQEGSPKMSKSAAAAKAGSLRNESAALKKNATQKRTKNK
jgi:hypothetical protein